MANNRNVILTADDYGASDFIDKGIIRGIKEGCINTVSAMINFDRSVDAIKKLKKDYPDVAIGLHVSITAGKPLSKIQYIDSIVDEEGLFYNLPEFLKNIKIVSLTQIMKETRLQLQTLIDTGIEVDHLSSHHNIMQMLTPLFRILLSLAREFKLPIRSTKPLSRFRKVYNFSPSHKKGLREAFQLAAKNTVSALSIMKYGTKREMRRNQNMMNHYSVKHPDYLADTLWGNPTPQNLKKILTNLPEGTSELVFHLGTPHTSTEDVPRGVDEDYYPFREYELFCATAPEFVRWIRNENINTIRFGEL